ncbi:methionyl-tRNA formyltransferase [Aurantimonas sp. HBX-1]|uniref:methionyl-tRNA formyltransferase n=1 Tax=Aurantimonas sp. HBX-1 TaxID=2906072 RepID=UPI001F018557|nr:methionyl-tRNA formyltransferase [Aurantimonas sp. HBX-1]UIJ71395.1 methionyl-tRNA formyltransferase [Aurantimonas sp. HBX-1]
MALRVGFMGTPAFAVPTLQAIVAAGHEVAAVYTQPPRRAGRRGLTLTPSPVQLAAERLGLAVRSPINFRDPADVEAFEALGLDVGVVVAYGLLLPQEILDAPRFGCLNGHGSLLPRWRGAAPIQRAIEAGDAVTGMMVMRMEAGLDTGPVALTAETPICEAETAGELHDRLAEMAASLMVEALAKLEAGTLTFEDQDALAARTGREPVYARKLTKAEAAIDFGGDAESIARKINAFAPAPGAFVEMALAGASERVKILRARAETGSGVAGTTLDDRLLVACGTGAVRLLELQRPGGKPMPAEEWLRGSPFAAGTRLVAASGT